jgi:site-specific recombinase XerD
MPQLSDHINLSNELKSMPISELIEKGKLLVKAKGYAQSTTWHYNGRFLDLQHGAGLFGTERLSGEFIAQYIEEGKQKSPKLACSSVQRKALLNLIATAANTAHIFAIENEADNIQIKSLRKNLLSYEQHLRDQEKRNETIQSYLQVATKFLLYLDRIEKSNPTEVTVIDIREFITDLGSKWSPRSMRIVPSLLKTYLKFAEYPIDTVLFSSFRTPRKSKPVRAMSTENVEALWKYVKSDDGDLRTKAIVTILLATGMRPVDITGLKLDDIDWNNNNIGFIQSKTGEGMNIELFPVMGSAITRYMTEERPNGTGIKVVFLTKRVPYRRLSPATCNYILKTAFKKIGFTFVADGLHCPRAIRRSLVSRMIAKGVPVQKAAAAIGHVDEKSVDLYTELDTKKMRSLCLPIPNPMNEWLST